MASKEQIKDPTHKRYYFYRVFNPGDNPIIEYRTGQGDWTGDWLKAELWSDLNFLKTKIKGQVDSTRRFHPSPTPHSYCIGEVEVKDNPMFFTIIEKV